MLERTQVIGSLQIEVIPGEDRYVRTTAPLRFYSVTLHRWCAIPAGFVMDYESVPLIRGTNPEAGAIHDYFSRSDSDPVVSKEVAAVIYLEFQAYYDGLEVGGNPILYWLNRAWDFFRRGFKSGVVRVAPFYFHEHKVKASLEELK